VVVFFGTAAMIRPKESKTAVRNMRGVKFIFFMINVYILNN